MRSNCKKNWVFARKFLQLGNFSNSIKKKKNGFCLTSSMVKQELNLEERILKPNFKTHFGRRNFKTQFRTLDFKD